MRKPSTFDKRMMDNEARKEIASDPGVQALAKYLAGEREDKKRKNNRRAWAIEAVLQGQLDKQ